MAPVRAPVVWDMLSMAGPVHPSRPGTRPGLSHNRTLQPSGCEPVLMQPVQVPSGEEESYWSPSKETEPFIPKENLHEASCSLSLWSFFCHTHNRLSEWHELCFITYLVLIQKNHKTVVLLLQNQKATPQQPPPEVDVQKGRPVVHLQGVVDNFDAKIKDSYLTYDGSKLPFS